MKFETAFEIGNLKVQRIILENGMRGYTLYNASKHLIAKEKRVLKWLATAEVKGTSRKVEKVGNVYYYIH